MENISLIILLIITHQRTVDETFPESGPDVVGRPGNILQNRQSRSSYKETVVVSHHDLPSPDASPDHYVGELQ